MKKAFVLGGIIVSAIIASLILLGESRAESESVKLEMVLVPAGTFQMGSNEFPNAKPPHTVVLSNDFYIGKFEVTNQQYADILNYALAKGYLDKKKLEKEKSEAWGISKSAQKYQDVGDEHSQITFIGNTFKPHPGKENFPVVEVTWYGAAFFCNMLSEKEGLAPLYNIDDWSCQVYGKTGYRLPTEAEWEYAAKFNDARPYPWGNAEADSSYANLKRQIKDPVEVATTPVGSYSPKGDSKLGICDLSGNVAKFCNDWYNKFDNAVFGETDPVGPSQSLYFYLPIFKQFRSVRVVRGGGFLFDPNYRKEYGVPFMIDSVLYEEAPNTSFRCYDILGFSRQVEGFRAVKSVATEKTKAAFSAPQK